MGVKRWLFGAVLLWSLPLLGCSTAELENRCFPMMALVDCDGEQVAFDCGFPELSQKDNTDVEESKVDAPMMTGETFREAYEKYKKELDKKADYNHLKILVFSEAFLQNREAFSQTVEYLQESGLFPRNVYVCVTDDVGALMEAEKNLPSDVGSYLETYLQNQESERGEELVNLGTVLDESENHRKTLQQPFLAVENDSVLWNGCYVLTE